MERVGAGITTMEMNDSNNHEISGYESQNDEENH